MHFYQTTFYAPQLHCGNQGEIFISVHLQPGRILYFNIICEAGPQMSKRPMLLLLKRFQLVGSEKCFVSEDIYVVIVVCLSLCVYVVLIIVI